MVDSAASSWEISNWLDDVQHALSHLYDPGELQKNPLVQALGLSEQINATAALRRIIIDAVDTLQPAHDAPAHNPTARYYQLLYQRYVEQYPQQEVAADLGLSVRQLRRIEKSALMMLAETLLAQFPPPAQTPSAGVDVDGELPAPTRQQELAWSQKVIPSETAGVTALLATALKTADPLFQTLGVTVEQSTWDHLPSLDVQIVAARQAVLSVLTTLARCAVGGRIAVHAVAQIGTVQVTIVVQAATGADLAIEAEALESLRLADELTELAGGRLRLDVDDGQSNRAAVHIHLPIETQVRIVALDDNPDILQLLRRYTAGTRYELTGVNDSRHLISTAEAVQPQMIILDIMLPGIDGWELLGRLRAHPSLGHLPIVVATILPQEQLASILGASAFLRKPIERRAFLALLDTQFDALWS